LSLRARAANVGLLASPVTDAVKKALVRPRASYGADARPHLDASLVLDVGARRAGLSLARERGPSQPRIRARKWIRGRVFFRLGGRTTEVGANAGGIEARQSLQRASQDGCK
jgi:hypothetical protein